MIRSGPTPPVVTRPDGTVMVRLPTIRLFMNSAAALLAERLTHHLVAGGQTVLMFQTSSIGVGNVRLLAARRQFTQTGMAIFAVRPESLWFALWTAGWLAPSVLLIVAEPDDEFAFPEKGAVRVQLNQEGRTLTALVKELAGVMAWARRQERTTVWAEVMDEAAAGPATFPG